MEERRRQTHIGQRGDVVKRSSLDPGEDSEEEQPALHSYFEKNVGCITKPCVQRNKKSAHKSPMSAIKLK